MTSTSATIALAIKATLEILEELDSMQGVIIFLVEVVVVLGLMEQSPYKFILVDKLLLQVVLV